MQDRGLVPSSAHLVISDVCCHFLTRYLDSFDEVEVFNNLPDVGAYVHQLNVVCIIKDGCSLEKCFFMNVCHRHVSYLNNISINLSISPL